jgi:adenine-specific DNA-methyltransferase
MMSTQMASATQLSMDVTVLTGGTPDAAALSQTFENPAYLSRQLLTYIGNKRALLEPIRDAIEKAQQRLGGRRLRIVDAFSGSGVVSRMFKQYADLLIVNDIEDYARAMSECYLTNRSTVSLPQLSRRAAELEQLVEAGAMEPGFIRELYSPADDTNIRPADRVFYTAANAYRLDTYRQLLEREPDEVRRMLIGPLLAAASIHANTAGVFKGFYKDRATGVGKFGGTGADALSRITASIRLSPPILSTFECAHAVYQADANEVIKQVGGVDVVYLDPPYNQHPYGSNYFMLNLLVNYRRPTEVSRVSGIPTDWRRSDYNVRSRALARFKALIDAADAPFLIVSFNDEGFITPEQMRKVLRSVGRVEEEQQRYPTFRGSRNLRNRSAHVTEHVYLVEKR